MARPPGRSATARAVPRETRRRAARCRSARRGLETACVQTPRLRRRLNQRTHVVDGEALLWVAVDNGGALVADQLLQQTGLVLLVAARVGGLDNVEVHAFISGVAGEL